MTEKIRMLKFGATWCGPCQVMAAKKTLEKFQEKHPEVEVVKYNLPEEEVECPKCGAYGEPGEECQGNEDAEEECGAKLPALPPEAVTAAKLADDYDVETIPTVVLLRGDSELARSEEAISLKDLEALYKEAIS